MHKSFKSSNFLNAIDKYAKKRRKKITDELEKIEEKELKKAETEIVEDVNTMIQRELMAMKNKILIEVSHKEIEERKKVSIRRRDIIKEMFFECKEKLLDYTKSEKYLDSLKEYAGKIAKALNSFDDVKLFVKKEDLKHEKEIKKAFGKKCEVISADDIEIGGIKGFSEVRGLIADETLDAKLNEQKDWAAENFGVLLV
ncbi:MAG: hypothetical protein IJJ04_04170 [Clostridia bacterium]|nr:hypothetical protein [Clostridia bacterium]